MAFGSSQFVSRQQSLPWMMSLTLKPQGSAKNQVLALGLLVKISKNCFNCPTVSSLSTKKQMTKVRSAKCKKMFSPS